MQSRFYTLKNIVGFETNDIMKEASKLIHFTLDLDRWSCVFLNKIYMISDLRFKVLVLLLEASDATLLLNNLKETFLVVKRLQQLNVFVNFCLESLEFN